MSQPKNLIVAWAVNQRRVEEMLLCLELNQDDRAVHVWKVKLLYPRRLTTNSQMHWLISHLRKRWSMSNALSQRKQEGLFVTAHIAKRDLVGNMSWWVTQKWKLWRGITPLNNTLDFQAWTWARVWKSSHVWVEK